MQKKLKSVNKRKRLRSRKRRRKKQRKIKTQKILMRIQKVKLVFLKTIRFCKLYRNQKTKTKKMMKIWIFLKTSMKNPKLSMEVYLTAIISEKKPKRKMDIAQLESHLEINVRKMKMTLQMKLWQILMVKTMKLSQLKKFQ